MQNANLKAAHDLGVAHWREIFAAASFGAEVIEWPMREPFGDAYNNPRHRAYRGGFDEAARSAGYTYSNVTGEYEQGGEYQNDDLEPLAE